MQVRERFEEAGGQVYEFAAAGGVNVHPNGVSLVMPETEARQRSTGNGASASANGTPGETLPGPHTPYPLEEGGTHEKPVHHAQIIWRSKLMSQPAPMGSLMSPPNVSANALCIAGFSTAIVVHADADALGVSGRLLIDCMGNFSPIVRQARWGQRPDGVCLVVGSCCRGFSENSTGMPL